MRKGGEWKTLILRTFQFKRPLLKLASKFLISDTSVSISSFFILILHAFSYPIFRSQFFRSKLPIKFLSRIIIPIVFH